eukprot:TRINITY_DN5857_c0_g1_i1.p1 TRINITY_DN5857_c0_g1~~TRINITY_DN5857_c0_g1_i1.p1  ORF type:complete len:120 (-),score=16.55 TRINITY_DN5857_c0_g1_i1:10-369(-)
MRKSKSSLRYRRFGSLLVHVTICRPVSIEKQLGTTGFLKMELLNGTAMNRIVNGLSRYCAFALHIHETGRFEGANTNPQRKPFFRAYAKSRTTSSTSNTGFIYTDFGRLRRAVVLGNSL